MKAGKKIMNITKMATKPQIFRRMSDKGAPETSVWQCCPCLCAPADLGAAQGCLTLVTRATE